MLARMAMYLSCNIIKRFTLFRQILECYLGAAQPFYFSSSLHFSDATKQIKAKPCTHWTAVGA